MFNQLPGKCEVKGLDSISKVNTFDEIKFTNDLHRVKHIQLSSGIDKNYMLITIDGQVNKYDLATRELLFSFKSVSIKVY